jgi:hypothetical protein
MMNIPVKGREGVIMQVNKRVGTDVSRPRGPHYRTRGRDTSVPTTVAGYLDVLQDAPCRSCF